MLAAVAVAVLLRQRESRAHRVAARNDGDLVQRVGMLKQHLHHRVASLVVSGGDALLLLDLSALVGSAPTNLVARLLEVGEFDEVLVGHGGDDRRLIDQCRKIRTGEHRRSAGDLLKLDIFGKLDLLGMDGQDLPAADDVGKVDRNLTVEAARARESGIEHIGAIGRRDDDHLRVRIKAVHLDEDRVERLLALVMSARRETTAAASADSVDFIEEDDAR